MFVVLYLLKTTLLQNYMLYLIILLYISYIFIYYYLSKSDLFLANYVNFR